MSLRYIRFQALLLACLCGLAAAAGAQAPPTPPNPAPSPPAPPAPTPPVPAPSAPSVAAPMPLTVLVVDVQALLQNSKAAKMVRDQIEQKRNEYTKEISHQEETLRGERDAIQRQQASLSADALNQKGHEFQQKVNDLERNVQGKRQALEKSNGEALSKIQEEMLKIIADIAKQHHEPAARPLHLVRRGLRGAPRRGPGAALLLDRLSARDRRCWPALGRGRSHRWATDPGGAQKRPGDNARVAWVRRSVRPPVR